MRTDEAWRHECEVRWLAAKPGQRIAEYLKLVEKWRGRPAAERLVQDVRVLRSKATSRKAG